jgi:hypothetical protein
MIRETHTSVVALFTALLIPLTLQAQNQAAASSIASGVSNAITQGANYSFIGSGWRNIIRTNGAGPNGMSFIGSGQSNTIGASWSVINGGFFNRISPNSTNGRMSFIGSGGYNLIGARYAVIAGGYSNTISANATGAAISGGYTNTNNAVGAVIAGGFANTASTSATGGAIGGGNYNAVSAPYGTVPGGFDNIASGSNSLAAGFGATANHAGTFVWADMSTNTDFISTSNNQFLIRAKNGVGINTNNPGTNSLAIAGNVRIGGAIQLNAIQILSGNGAPSMPAPNGSIYINASANSPTNGLYVRFGTTWFALQLDLAP